MLALTLSDPTWLHRVPAGAKLAGLALATIAVLPISEPMPALGATAIVLALYASCGQAAIAKLALVRPLVPLLAIVFAAQGLLASWGEAAAVTVRILAMVWLANLVTLTTRLSDMLDALAVVLAPLRLVRVSPRDVALAVALVIRFVPVLLEEWRAIGEAWRARTGRRPGPRLLAPFALRMLDVSERVGEALHARYARPRRPRS